jgi:DNA-binding NtrC family response regulator
MKQKKMATLKELEKEMILAALERNKMNKCAAARELGCSPGTIRNKLKEYKLVVREVVVPSNAPESEAVFEAWKPSRSKLRG